MKFWKRIDGNGVTSAVESYSFDDDIKGAVEITRDEFDAFISSIPKSPPPRDLAADIDALKAQVTALDSKTGTLPTIG